MNKFPFFMRQTNKTKDMTTEKQYRMAKRLYYFICVLLPLCVCLLLWNGYDYLRGNEEMHNVASSLLSTCLFTVLLIRNRKIKKDYESKE